MESQYGDRPIALTTEATQDGPVFEPDPPWSEFLNVGVTQLTVLRFPLETSVKKRSGGETMFLTPLATVVNVLDCLIGAPNAVTVDQSDGIKRPRKTGLIELVAERLGIPARNDVALRKFTSCAERPLSCHSGRPGIPRPRTDNRLKNPGSHP